MFVIYITDILYKFYSKLFSEQRISINFTIKTLLVVYIHSRILEKLLSIKLSEDAW